MIREIAKRQAEIDYAEVGIYRILYEDDTVDYVAAKLGALEKDLCSFLHRRIKDGKGDPCYWHTRHPFGVTFKANEVRSVLEVPLVEIYRRMVEDGDLPPV